MAKKNEIAKGVTRKFTERTVMVTTDYDKFKTLTGNRDVNRGHVAELQHLLLENGNLTDQFPIVVSKDMFVIDGQHRLAALKQLGWEVGYIIEERATIETVRAINRGNQPWNWRDVAHSYYHLGQAEYKWFEDYVDENNLQFLTALTFCGVAESRRTNSAFYDGRMVIKDKERAQQLADQYNELRGLVASEGANYRSSRPLARAFMTLLRSPNYKHERMIQKIQEYDRPLSQFSSAEDFLRELEKIYNTGRAPESKQRLF